MAKLGTAQTTARNNTPREVARKDGRNIAFYPLRVRAANENRGLEIRARRGGCRSVQLKIKRHGQNNFDLLSVNRSRFCPPLLHGGNGGIGERWITFKKFLHLDAAVSLHPHLELHDPLQAGALRERRIRRLWRINEPLLEIVGILGQASPEGNFQVQEPALEPVGLCPARSNIKAFVNLAVHIIRLEIGNTLTDTLDLLANKRIAQSNLRIYVLEPNLSGGAAQLERRTAAIQDSRCMHGTTQTVGGLH